MNKKTFVIVVMFRKSKHAIFDSKKFGTTVFLQKNFISLFFVCTTCIPADVTDNSASNGGAIKEIDIVLLL